MPSRHPARWTKRSTSQKQDHSTLITKDNSGYYNNNPHIPTKLSTDSPIKYLQKMEKNSFSKKEVLADISSGNYNSSMKQTSESEEPNQVSSSLYYKMVQSKSSKCLPTMQIYGDSNQSQKTPFSVKAVSSSQKTIKSILTFQNHQLKKENKYVSGNPTTDTTKDGKS